MAASPAQTDLLDAFYQADGRSGTRMIPERCPAQPSQPDSMDSWTPVTWSREMGASRHRS